MDTAPPAQEFRYALSHCLPSLCALFLLSFLFFVGVSVQRLAPSLELEFYSHEQGKNDNTRRTCDETVRCDALLASSGFHLSCFSLKGETEY